MRLRRLLDDGVESSVDLDILSVTADSREVRPGTLFAALAGSKADGRDFIDEAVKRGAAAVLADLSLEGREIGVPLILDPEPRRRFALIAARFFESQPRHVAAVTGTNGKTSVASFVRQLWQDIRAESGVSRHARAGSARLRRRTRADHAGSGSSA